MPALILAAAGHLADARGTGPGGCCALAWDQLGEDSGCQKLLILLHCPLRVWSTIMLGAQGVHTLHGQE